MILGEIPDLKEPKDWLAGTTVSAAILAKWLNLKVRRVLQLTEEGIIFKSGRGQYDLIRSVQGYIAYLQERAEGRRTAESADLHSERTRLFKEQADAMEIKNRLQRGEIVPVERVSAALGKVASAIATILESIPIRCKRANPSLTQADLDIVRAEIVKARNECADLRPE